MNQSRGRRNQFITTKIARKIQPRTMLAFLKIANTSVVVVRRGKSKGRIFQSNGIEILQWFVWSFYSESLLTA